MCPSPWRMVHIELDQRNGVKSRESIVRTQLATMRAFVTAFLAALAATCAAHSIPAALFTPYVPVHPLDEGYFPLPKYFHRVETGLVQEHPVVRFPRPQPAPYAAPSFVHHPQEPQHQPQAFHHHEKPYLTFVAPTSSLVAYVPVQRGTQGPWAVPNVFIKGQGYSTNQYVATAVMKRYLAQDPR